MGRENLDDVLKGLELCSEWITDKSGELRKDCWNCPYRDENDPAGMACGERLMKDAKFWIEEMHDD